MKFARADSSSLRPGVGQEAWRQRGYARVAFDGEGLAMERKL
ncbi:MAG: hypothetical protein ACREP0_03190 [Rhodanobacteraceae bacterium]